MSSIATMYSFSRQFGLKYYVTQEHGCVSVNCQLFPDVIFAKSSKCIIFTETCTHPFNLISSICHSHEQEQHDLLTYYFQPSTLDLAVVDVALANLSPFGLGVNFNFHPPSSMLLYRCFPPPLGEALVAAGGQGHAV